MYRVAPVIAAGLRWAFTIIAVALFARLLLMMFRLVFNFWETPIGLLLHEGSLFDQIGDLSPLKLALQLTITVLIMATVIFGRRSTHKAGTDRDDQ